MAQVQIDRGICTVQLNKHFLEARTGTNASKKSHFFSVAADSISPWLTRHLQNRTSDLLLFRDGYGTAIESKVITNLCKLLDGTGRFKKVVKGEAIRGKGIGEILGWHGIADHSVAVRFDQDPAPGGHCSRGAFDWFYWE